MTPIRYTLFLSLLVPVVGAEEITLNFVVKDRKGVAIKNLDSSQIEVTDGGVKRQPVVRLIDSEQPERRERLFVLAFEPMALVDRRLAKAAMLRMLEDDGNQNHLFSVFVFSNQLALLQPFTADRGLLAKAVELATSGVQNTQFAEVHDANKRALASDDSLLGRTQRKMLAFDGRLADTEQPRRAIAFLNSLATGLAGYPGRKAIAYLTWGLVVPSFVEAAFQGLEARANRAGVSFYGIDSRGVSEASENDVVREDLSRIGGQAVVRGTENSTGVDFDRGDLVQEALRGSPQAKLRVLSEATGGFLVAGNNDPRPLLRQMAGDIDTYYEVTYDPGIANFDGSYRKTSFKVNAKDVRVRGRDGYLALRAGQIELLPYELPLLSALSASPLPRDVMFRTGAVRLHQGKDEITASVLVEVPLAGLDFKENKAAGLYAGRLTMLTQVKDTEGRIVRKFSRELPLQGKLEQLAALQASNFNFREQFTVPPGRYIVETAIADIAAGKTSAKRVSFQAAARTAGVALSGITLVRSFQPNQTGLTPDEPFQFKGGRVTPTLNQTLKAVKGAQMSLYFMVYPDQAAGAAQPEVVVRYLKEGAELARAAMPLAAADASGKIPYVFSSPIDTIPPGLYEIKVQVKQGSSVAEESVLVTIEG